MRTRTKIVGLLTDFGTRDYYVSAMKGVILSICPEAKIIDISHEIEKWNVFQGAFVLKQVTEYFPHGSVLIGVVDPGVGSKRKMIVIEGRKHYFVGPDNGLLTLAVFNEGIKKIVEIKNQKYYLNRAGTFDGRDVFAPVAAHILNGTPLDEIGPEITSIVKLSLPKPIIKRDRMELTVLHIDSFGNIITNVKDNEFMSWSGNTKKYKLVLNNELFTLSFSRNYRAKTRLFFIPGSSGLIEISMSMASAAKKLKVRPGTKIEVFKLT